MTVLRYLASTFQFDENVGIVDAADIVTNLKAILLAQTPAWTNPSGDTMKSPVDSAGRFMTLILAAPSSSRFQITFVDQNGLTVATRELALIAGPLPTTINYFTGQYHCYLESLTGGSGAGEWVGAFMIDPTDYDLEDNQNYLIGGGYRNSGGSIDGQGGVWDQFFMLESGVTQIRQRSRAVSTAPGANIGLLDFAGNPQSFPFDVLGVPSGSNRWMGSAYQTQVFDPSVAAGVIKPMAIDDSTPASWRTTVVPANSQGSRLALRVV
jgi:hypothetical protein